MSSSQLYAVLALLLLCPALRLFPTASIGCAGSSSWLCGILAFPVLLGYMRIINSLTKHRENGEICTNVRENIPAGTGRIALYIPALWFTLYAAFVLRSGADRMIKTVYSGTPEAFFIVTLAVPSLAAALCPAVITARLSKLVLPIVGGVLAVIIIASAVTIRAENLSFPTVKELPGLVKGTVPAVDVLSLPIYAAVLLKSETGAREHGRMGGTVWLGTGCLLLTAINLAITGFFGSELAVKLDWPFFSLVRNLVFPGKVERAEPLVVALWIFTDFTAVSLSLRLGAEFLTGDREKRKKAAVIEAVLCCTLAMVIAPDRTSLERWSQRIIPAVNMGFAFVCLPLMLLLSKKRSNTKYQKDRKSESMQKLSIKKRNQ